MITGDMPIVLGKNPISTRALLVIDLLVVDLLVVDLLVEPS